MKIFFTLPDTGVGLGKPRGDIMAFPLYQTAMVEMLAIPTTTVVQH